MISADELAQRLGGKVGPPHAGIHDLLSQEPFLLA